jgi:hypothetical protein
MPRNPPQQAHPTVIIEIIHYLNFLAQSLSSALLVIILILLDNNRSYRSRFLIYIGKLDSVHRKATFSMFSQDLKR